MEDTLRIDAYEAQIVPIRPESRGLLHELTMSVLWPHRDSDLDLLMRLGAGYVALDAIGRPMGAAMHFPMGDDFAMLGMMVTPPRLQAQGGGRFLLKRILQDCAGRDIRLNATRSGYRLYLSEGFERVTTIHQHQGIAGGVPATDPASNLELAIVAPADGPAIREMDAAAFGAGRGATIDALMAVSNGIVATRSGRPCGFALMRRFGKGHVIGPLVAESEEMAIQIVAPLLRQSEGSFVRIDTPQEGGALTAFLTASGVGAMDTVTEMRKGPHRRATEGLRTYGLAAHSLG
ncbi:N-acetyltransferase [Palleronia sp. LCG004]|uniref:N-acetyltransferase n=1 Tax=Palleronia sp. LCG004 TaxID=3079304 RepID=UPI00294242CD|nr:N-acetyltransferase [Palleronia sp. LCG004]WOI58105.1 N-acetyltransferase [Palleronia sp. LCG004]